MTLGFDQWLRLLGFFGVRDVAARNIPELDLSRLGCRDIADLNLPHDVRNEAEWRACW